MKIRPYLAFLFPLLLVNTVFALEPPKDELGLSYNNPNSRGEDSRAPSKSTCTDTDGDGWGWDGKKSCKVSTNSSEVSNKTTVPTCLTNTTDKDGDGWGWENGKSCKVIIDSLNDNHSDSCQDSDGDGYGWDGSKTCLVETGVQTSALGTLENPLPSASIPRCIDWNRDGRTTIFFPPSNSHFFCNPDQIGRCRDYNGDGKGVTALRGKYYKCLLRDDQVSFKIPEPKDFERETTVPICSDSSASKIKEGYFKEESKDGEYLWPCAKRCTNSKPNYKTYWDNEGSEKCISGGPKRQIQSAFEIVKKPESLLEGLDVNEKIADILDKGRVTTLDTSNTKLNSNINLKAEKILDKIEKFQIEGIGNDIDLIVQISLDEMHLIHENPNSTFEQRLDAYIAVRHAQDIADSLSWQVGEKVRIAQGLTKAQANMQALMIEVIIGKSLGDPKAGLVTKKDGRKHSLNILSRTYDVIRMILGSADVPKIDPKDFDSADYNYDGHISSEESAIHGRWAVNMETLYGGEYAGTPVVVPAKTKTKAPAPKPQGGGADEVPFGGGNNMPSKQSAKQGGWGTSPGGEFDTTPSTPDTQINEDEHPLHNGEESECRESEMDAQGNCKYY